MQVNTFKLRKEDRKRARFVADLAGESFSEFVRKSIILRSALLKKIKDPKLLDRFVVLISERS